jgi:hypothetical protein
MAQALALAMDELHTLIGNAVSCENHRHFAAASSLNIMHRHDESNGHAVGGTKIHNCKALRYIL